ncbi:Zinc finger protein ZAT3 [Carex littledalei]|uniref:Zinc finger protein ZAT3 n=1 Tax=Carex littledalei TaxID=544730 RepID=A0A833QYJ3_9POAL|nr:Zinc finger protein ZAT3 [Carex littledalei]
MSNLHLSLYSLSASSGETPPLKPKRTKKKPNTNPSTETSIFKTNNVSPCSECGKQFNTWKALFGHMRCHPERQWRGMNKKPKPKPRQKQQDWEVHISDEVTNAALILMQMSGRSFREMCIESLHERKTSNLCIDLNLPPPVEED